MVISDIFTNFVTKFSDNGLFVNHQTTDRKRFKSLY